MGAVSEATAPMVIGALEAVEFAIGRAKAGGCRQGGEVCARCLLHRCRERAGSEGIGEGAGAFFERRQIGRCVLSHRPRVFEPGGIVIADDGLALARGKVPPTPLRGAVGEVPGKQESELGRAARWNRPLLTNRAYGAAGCWLVQQSPVLREGVPK